MTQIQPTPDLDTLLLRERIVFLAGPLDVEAANRVIARLLYLDAVEPGEDVWLYLTSPSGEAASALAVHDVLRAMRSDVRTYAVGELIGPAALLLAAGAPGKRSAMPSARVAWQVDGPRAGELAAALGRVVPPDPLTAVEALAAGFVDRIEAPPVHQPA